MQEGDEMQTKKQLTRSQMVDMLKNGAALAVAGDDNHIVVSISDTDGCMYVIKCEEVPRDFCWRIL
jgi:hypothetical protein